MVTFQIILMILIVSLHLIDASQVVRGVSLKGE